MQLVLDIYVFIMGLAFGSFTLAMVDRMKAGKDWVKGRSQCDHCGHKLAVIDLVPLLSWLSQRGRCRYCKKRLSISYPGVELLSGLLFLLSYEFFPFEISGLNIAMLILWLFATVLLVGLIVFDLRWYLLPNALVYPLIGTGIVHRIIQYISLDENLGDAIFLTSLSVVIGFGLFWAIYKASKGKWIGDGDYRLGFAMAIFLSDPIQTWLALFVASVAGLIATSVFALKNKKIKKTLKNLKIPFGPFLILGLYVSYLFGENIINWYSTTFLYL